MTSIKTIFFVKLLSIWNWLWDSFYSIKSRVNGFISHLSLYFNNDTHTWLFVSGHSLPISLMHIYNTIHATWKYDYYSNQLICLHQASDKYSINWLSANIIVFESDSKRTTYEMDSFLNQFRIYTNDESYPSVSELFNCWCIYTKHWFSPMMNIIIHYIDTMGDEYDININDSTIVFVKVDKNHLGLRHK